jgi:pyruvate/2-oxoglutarate dehydrogenase complex dihydrolipoamide acyltransferase (E2) component
MATEVVMPQMGESIAEGTITKWLVKVGDKVDRDQPLFEISTDKVDAEIPSPAAGVVLEIRHKEGETVPVSQVVAIVGEQGEAAGEGAEKAAKPAKAAGENAPKPDDQPAVAAAATPGAGKPAGDFDYDLVIVGSGPGGYVAGDPRRPARAQGRLRREGPALRRHLHAARLHPDQGAAALGGRARRDSPRRRLRRRDRRAEPRHRQGARLQARHRRQERQGHRVPVQEEQGRPASRVTGGSAARTPSR